MVKLKRLKIHRYRDVEPCELVFSDRFNILLGPNGAGKTTLLDLISKVLRSKLDDASDPLSVEIELTFPGGALTGTIETMDDTSAEPSELPVEMRAARATRASSSHAAQTPMFNLRVSHLDPAATAEIRRVDDEVIVTSNGDSLAARLALRLFAIVPRGLVSQAMIHLQLALLRDTVGFSRTEIQNASRFDESLDTFRAITARQSDTTVISADLRPAISYSEIAPDAEERSAATSFPLAGIVPPSILDLIASRFVDGATDVSFDHGDLGFLSDTVRLLALRSATTKIELIDKHVRKRLPGADFYFGNLNFWFTRKDGSVFQAQHLSYGQKRLLTFLYYLDCNPSIVIADELVNGLHHAWIQECMKAIGDRQSFLTSQNPLLLDYLSFDSVQQVKESFILCRNETVGDRDKMIWRNLSDDEADMFYSAYSVGIEHVGEILRTRGLW